MVKRESYIIELDDDAVGVVVAYGSRVTFHASDARMAGLEGRVFEDAGAAVRAARSELRKAA